MPIDSRKSLLQLLDELRARDRFPKNIQTARLGSLYFCSVSNHDMNNEIISETIFQGCSDDVWLATMKAYVEFIERSAFAESKDRSPSASAISERSDGFAAFPSISIPFEEAVLRARQNARMEAFERFVWSKWWDDQNIGFDIFDREIANHCSDFLNELFALQDIEQIVFLVPHVQADESNSSTELVVALAWLKGGGCITGGAAGKKTNRNETVIHSLNELVRHIFSISRFRSEKIEPDTFYHKRLLFFGTGQGDNLVRFRLRSKGKDSVVLPPFAIDELIEHSMQDICVVWRSLYQGQLPFMGGRIDRLCI